MSELGRHGWECDRCQRRFTREGRPDSWPIDLANPDGPRPRGKFCVVCAGQVGEDNLSRLGQLIPDLFRARSPAEVEEGSELEQHITEVFVEHGMLEDDDAEWWLEPVGEQWNLHGLSISPDERALVLRRSGERWALAN